MPFSAFDPTRVAQLAEATALLTVRDKPQLDERAGPLVDVFQELLAEPVGAFPFPIGSILPSSGKVTGVQLDRGVDTAPKKALAFLLLLENLPKTYEEVQKEGGTKTLTLRIGPLANLLRQGLPDFLSWQHEAIQARFRKEESAGKLLPISLLEAVRLLVEESDDLSVRDAWLRLHRSAEQRAHAATSVEELKNSIALNFRNDSYHRSIKSPVASVTRRETAARKDASAHMRPTEQQLVALTRDIVKDPLELKAVSDALQEPFGGRRLLAALYVKLVLNHLGLVITSVGDTSPVDKMVSDVALQVLNAVAATSGHPQAATAATMAAALRLQRLGHDSDAATSVLISLPEAVQNGLPACFRRELLHFPDAACGMARVALAQAQHGRGQPWLEHIDGVASLAHLAASLALDWLQTGALGLHAEQFAKLSIRIEHLKKGGTSARLQKMAPDATFRTQVLLPQLHRTLTLSSFMARAGASTLGKVRQQLHGHPDIRWPAVPTPDASRPPARGGKD